MIEPVSRTIKTRNSSELWAIVGDQPFRNSMLVDDSLEMIDVCQFSCDRKLAV